MKIRMCMKVGFFFVLGGIPNEVLQDMENKFSADPKNRLAQNVCYTANPKQILKNQSSLNKQVHVFSCKVE